MNTTIKNKEEQERLRLSLGFEDVLILPGYTDFSPSEISLESSLNDKLSLSLPFLSAAMDTVTEYSMARAMTSAGALGVLNRNMSEKEIVEAVEKLKAEFGDSKPYAFAIGVSTPIDVISRIVLAGGNVLVVDSAHGHSKNVGEKVKQIVESFPSVFVIAGNVVTIEGADYLISCGAHAVKVGIGSGSICTTRLITGVGSGDFSSIKEIASFCSSKGVLTVADGGLNHSDEIIKALAAGADLVMLGYLLAGTNESPGEVKLINNQEYKLYRGMGSKAAMQKGSADRYDKEGVSFSTLIQEGVESYVKCKGSVQDVLTKLKSELQIGFRYIGARNISELHSKAKFVQITNAVSKKSKVHTIDIVKD